MSLQPPTIEPVDPGEPSNRWPWVALAGGVLIIVIAIAFYFYTRPRTVNVLVEGTPTVNPVARAGTASPGPPPTLVPPTLPASATLAPTATPLPSATPVPPTPAPTQPPTPAPTQPPPTQPAAAAPPPPAQPTTPPPPPPPAQPTTPPPAPPPAQPTTPPAPPSPTPFAGQVANAGGLGNTRSDLDSAYGAPAGETPEHLVVYRKNNIEYHVMFVPDPNGRAAVIAELPQGSAQPWTIEQATGEGHKLLPKDGQPPNPQAESTPQYVVERYTSQSLAQALPAQAFTANNGQPGQFMVVYVKDSAPGNRITRIVLGPGNDPQALINQGR